MISIRIALESQKDASHHCRAMTGSPSLPPFLLEDTPSLLTTDTPSHRFSSLVVSCLYSLKPPCSCLFCKKVFTTDMSNFHLCFWSPVLEKKICPSPLHSLCCRLQNVHKGLHQSAFFHLWKFLPSLHLLHSWTFPFLLTHIPWDICNNSINHYAFNFYL